MSTPHHTEEVRRLVRAMLEDAPAYAKLAPADRQKLARQLVDVMAYLADPYAGLAKPGTGKARALDDANATLKNRLSQQQHLVGEDFKAGAAREGAQVFQTTTASVDFPGFVTGLVNGVYQSIVKSSIQQMQEYGKMLEVVTKSVDQFAKENISEQEAREFIKSSFPGQIDLDPSTGALTANEDSEAPKPDFKAILEMKENIELTEENEKEIVLAAQIKMARQRQQTLAQMVAMGINRIIVTDGEIKASVLFDMKSKDTAQRGTDASVSDRTTYRKAQGGGWFSDDPDEVQTSVSSAYAQEHEQSTSTLDMRAKLSGSVTVKFKSETFPLERLASSQELGAVQQKSTR